MRTPAHESGSARLRFEPERAHTRGGARRTLAAVAAAVVVSVGAPAIGAHALITSWTGAAVNVAAPPSLRVGQFESNTVMAAIEEAQNVTLASDLRVDITQVGTYSTVASLETASFVTAGTKVDSHILHADPVANAEVTFEGTVTFASDIIGIAATRATLGTSDVLGAPGTLYPGGSSGREAEFTGNSGADIVVLPDHRTVQVRLHVAGANDQVRIITAGNAPAVVSAGGPYVASEGTAVVLAGSVSDADGDVLTQSWTATWTGDPGTVCSLTSAATLTPSLSCTDDALVTTTLSVSDGVNPTQTSTAQVTVGNVAPTPGTLTVPNVAVPLGTPADLTLDFADAGTNDTHTTTISWGDTTSSMGVVNEASGAGIVTDAHTYVLPGLYTATVTLSDDDNGTATGTAQILVDGPPAADAGGPYAGSEGLPTTLAGTAIDPEGDPLVVGWTFTPGATDPGASCAASGADTLTPSLTCDDDAVVVADLAANDGVNPAVVSSTVVAVANEAPLLGVLSAPTGPIAVGAAVSVLAPFTDDGANDTHTGTVDWGDLTASAASISEAAGSGALGASHAYAAPGIYTIVVTLEDDDLGSDVRTATVVVNSPPTASTGGPYAGTEGAALALSGSALDLDGDALTISWSFAVTGAPGTVCSPIGAGTLTPTLTCNDDASVVATLTVSDGVNPAVTDATTITVGNASPLSAGAVGSADTAPNGSTVSVGLAFADDGTNDSHTATIDWGDSTIDTVPVISAVGSGTVSGSHVYTVSGLYTITVTVTDDDGATTVQTTNVVINGAPTAGAGGPYSGVEGAPVTLNGTASDPDIDVLATSWSYTIVTADVGTACSLVDATTLTPTLTCDDDALVDVTITVDDGVNPIVVDSVSVDIENGDPAVAAPTVAPNPVALGSAVALATTFTDPGLNDNHTATIRWGDTAVDPGAVTEIPGSGSVTGGHTYAAAGTYDVEVVVNDKDGGTNLATVAVVVNAPPSVDAAGPYSGLEGVPLPLAGTAVDPDGDPLALSWSFDVAIDAGGTCTMSGTATLVPSITCNDDATITATLTADDGVNAPVTDIATVAIANQAPGIGLVTVPATPVPVGTSISALTTFVEPGANDTHTASVSWGDATSSTGVVTETAGNGSVAATHSYAVAGTYSVAVTIVDDDTGTVTGTAISRVTVFDGSSGFVTGGGWINSPSGAYTPNNPNDANLVGRAEFGFVARKRLSDPLPTGSTEFQLRIRSAHSGRDDGRDDDRDGHDDDGYGDDGRCRDGRRDDGWSRAASFNFKSTGYQSLLVTDNNTKALYQGTGKVNGVAGYEFLVSVIDGRKTRTPDRFRIKVWNSATGEVLYDNMSGAPNDAAATTPVSSGSIVIH